MASEERLMILQMVSEGKISAQEAAELIRALDAGKGNQGDARTADSTSESAEPNWLSRVIEDVVSSVTNIAQTKLGPKHEFSFEHSSDLPEGDMTLDLRSGNGKIHLMAWDQPTYKANIRVEVRAANKDEAEQLAANAYKFEVEEGRILWDVKRGDFMEAPTVHLELLLPKDRVYGLDARTGNGSVKMEGLNVVTGRIAAGNGSVKLYGGAAQELSLRTGNGSMTIGTIAKRLDAATGNGSITYQPTGGAQDVKLTTGNGSVTVQCHLLPTNTGLKVDAHTGMGSVNIHRHDLVVERQERALGHKHAIVHTPNYAEAEQRIDVKVRTGLGRVSID